MKCKKPYKRNISSFLANFEDVSFSKKTYTNEEHVKVTSEEKALLGIFDLSFYNLEKLRKMAKTSMKSLTGGRLDKRIREATKEFV